MNPADLAKKAAVQRGHAIRRAKERYGLRLDETMLHEFVIRIRRRIQSLANGGRNDVSTRALYVGDQGLNSIWRVHYLGEWMWVIYDGETKEIATFLPRHIKHVKGFNIETVPV